MRAHHDMGGLPAGPVCPADHVIAPWEKRIHAMVVLLADPQREIVSVHELRRAIEGLGSEEYDRLSYYERWITAMANVMLEKGFFTADELGRKLEEVAEREGGAMTARFQPGDPVRVRRAFPPGHIRTPFYIRGKRGVIERVLAAFPNPEERAYGRKGEPAPMLYRVRFPQTEIWADYRGPAHDTVDIELYEHWLDQVETPVAKPGGKDMNDEPSA